MTQWVENPTGGRDRGPQAIARAWVEVLVRPGRFFRHAVAPGDQAPGLVFVVLVVLIEESTRVLVARLAASGRVGTGPFEYPLLATLGPYETVLYLLAAVVFVTPVALHLVAAIQTLVLVPFAPDRGGVSETVQVVAYATAPCVFVGLPIPEVRLVCTVWGTLLFAYGLSEVHGLSPWRAIALGAIPAAIVFGSAFRGFLAAGVLL